MHAVMVSGPPVSGWRRRQREKCESAPHLANVLVQHLVQRAHHWRGVSSLVAQLQNKTLTVRRPHWFFDKNGTMPERVELTFGRPAGFESAARRPSCAWLPPRADFYRASRARPHNLVAPAPGLPRLDLGTGAGRGRVFSAGGRRRGRGLRGPRGGRGRRRRGRAHGGRRWRARCGRGGRTGR